ncbi:MAG: UDP-N-acetylmuramoyl-tripeptide--D-alanyl-D-alanine ligase [Verrucomicrobia bacterium]|nr:UDP-N-acetylmuramoyl-tripeptide--D-alanyl-D-alanine ligase [Cytophagales bacterium]
MNIEKLYNHFLRSQGVSTDSRHVKENSLFFALKGEKFNGNHFANQALAQGANFAIIDEPAFKNDDRCIVVENVLETLQHLARFHRQQLNIPIIGITGSNGKTTHKELIAAILSKKYSVFATQGNLNNHIGVPLTLLAMNQETQIGVIEMGANHQREIALLASICMPTHGIITNIGKAHLEGFGGVEGIKVGKGELYDFLFENKGTVFINSRDLVLMEMLNQRFEKYGRDKIQLINYPAKGDFFTCQLVQASPFVAYEDENGNQVETQLIGSHNFINLAAALCIGKCFEVAPALANQAISEYIPENNRSQVQHKGSNTLILDAYNANPSSMEVSLQAFADMKADKKVVILGDMFELGEESQAEHSNIGNLLAKLNFDTILLCGKQMQAAVSVNPKAYYFLDKFSLHNWLMDNKFENSHILLKGSRGMSLESALAYL